MVDYFSACLAALPTLPRLCVCCGARCQTVPALCEACMEVLPRSSANCYQCAISLAESAGKYCGACLSEPPAFEHSVAAFCYEFPARELINRFKFQADFATGEALSHCLAKRIQNSYAADSLPHRLVPVPLYRHRLRQRGFNQSLLIARSVGQYLGIPVTTALISQSKPTLEQKTLNAEQRRQNLRGVFQVNRGVSGHIAVVDDVVTTTATSRELARVLRKAGATRVDNWCLGRTPCL